MGITLAEPRPDNESLDSVKSLTVGDVFVGRIVDFKTDIPVKDFDTGQVVLNERTGNPKTQYLLLCLVMEGTTAKVGKNRQYRDAEVGEVVAMWVGGLDKYNSDNAKCFDDVRKAHGAINVGDVVKRAFVREQAPSNPKYNATKINEFGLRRAKEGEESAVADAEREYTARQQPTQLASAPAAGVPDLEDF